MAFSDILSAAIPVIKSIIGNEIDQYDPHPKSENPYRECLYRTLDTLDGELANRKKLKQQEDANRNNDIPSKEMILAKLQSDTPTTYSGISNKSYKWSHKI